MASLLVAFGKTMRATYNLVRKVQSVTSVLNFMRNPLQGLIGNAVTKVLGGPVQSIVDSVTSGVVSGLGLDTEAIKAGEQIVDAAITGNSPLFEQAMDDLLNAMHVVEGGPEARKALLDTAESLTTLFNGINDGANVLRAARGKTAAINTLIGDGSLARELKEFRVPIQDGRIVGIHGKKFLLLSFLNEFLNPRPEGVNIDAYFRLPVAERDGSFVELTGAATLDPSLRNSTVGGLVKAIRENANVKASLAEKTVDEAGNELHKRLQMTLLAESEMARSKAYIQAQTKLYADGDIGLSLYRHRVITEIKALNFKLELLAVGGLGNISDEQLANMHKRTAASIYNFAQAIDKQADILRGGADAGNTIAQRGSLRYEKAFRLMADGRRIAAFAETQGDGDSVREMFTDKFIDKLGEQAVGPAFEFSQQAYRDLLSDISKQTDETIYEVRRLESGVKNCDFCIEVADDPQPVGVLPPIGDPSCYNIKYNGLYCYCKMDIATDEEVNSIAENAAEVAAENTEEANIKES